MPEELEIFNEPVDFPVNFVDFEVHGVHFFAGVSFYLQGSSFAAFDTYVFLTRIFEPPGSLKGIGGVRES